MRSSPPLAPSTAPSTAPLGQTGGGPDGPQREAERVRRRRTAAALLLLTTAALAALAWWWRLGVPVPIAEPGADRLECVSYAPFRRPGETPFDPRAFVDEARIELDLRLLSAQTGCVRTYAVSQGLDAVPRVARRLGMQVLLGAWLGRDRAGNEAELSEAIRIAREHPDVVRALVVGNEVMLRRELPEAELVAHIERARREAGVPVTYADVWEFWLEHPGIAPAVSFVTIHILPYWEDEPVGIDGAIAHVIDVHARMRAALPGRDLLVGETGWPSDGRARREAVPGRVEQARFIREFTRAASEHDIRYNLIEGFDQPWKRHLEGAMGGAWGLLDSDGRPKFEWHGPVAHRPGWQSGIWAGLAGALLGSVWLGAGVARAGARRAVTLHAAIGASGGAVLGALLAEQLRYMTVWNRSPLEWGVSTATTVAVIACFACSGLLLARRLSDGSPDTAPRLLPPIAAVLRDWIRGGRDPDLAGWTAVLHGAVLFAAAVTVVLHGFDARYRGFDWPLFAPAALAAALLWIGGMRRDAGGVEERWLAAVTAVGAVTMVLAEGPQNRQALCYAALMLVLAACAAARTRTSSPSSAPTTAGS